MKSVRRKIILSASTNPELGTYIHICRSIRDSNLPRRNILKLFNEFMADYEYEKDEKGELVDYLVLQSIKNL